MDELEAQVARLAARRADSVPPFALTDLDRFAAARSTRRVLAYAAVAASVLALLIGGGFLVFSGSGDSPSVHSPAATPGPSVAPTVPPTTVPSTAAATTTLPPTCPALDGADGSAKSGSESAGVPLPLVNVQVEASDCVDEVSFVFGGGIPGWSVSYQPGPLTLEPSGQPAQMAGSAFYVIRFQPASNANGTYAGSTDVRPTAPSAVGQVLRLQDFEGVMTWAIGFDAQHPFRVVTRDGTVAVQFASVASPRAMTCTNQADHVQYDVPPGWFVETNPDLRPCTEVAAEPFTIIPNSDGPTPYALVVLRPEPPVADTTQVILSTRDASVDGRATTVTEAEWTGTGLMPAGYRSYHYSVDWSPAGTLVLSVTGSPGPEFDARKAGLDALAASVRYLD
jgi:hypothetical protein